MSDSKFTMTTTIIKKSSATSWEGYVVILEGGGFKGEARSGNLGYAFTEAYDELMAKVAEGTFSREVQAG